VLRAPAGTDGILEFLSAPPKTVSSLIVLVGKEHVLADRALRTIVETALPDPGLRDLNVDTLDASAVDHATDVAARLAALPFLAERRMVIVRGTIDLKKEDREELVAATVDVPEHAVLVIDHAGRPARPQGRRPREEAATFAAGTRGSLLLECALDARGCERFIDETVPTLGVKIEGEARAALAATEDVSEILNALERLALTTKKIRVADVREYAIPPQDAKLWDLADAVIDCDAHQALALAREFSDNPIGPLQWLAGDAQAIWELSTGARADAYARESGQNMWRIGKLVHRARRIAPALARRNVDLTMKALERSISGVREPAPTLDEVIVRLCEKTR
jgi:DNA polymerase III delta subunit